MKFLLKPIFFIALLSAVFCQKSQAGRTVIVSTRQDFDRLLARMPARRKVRGLREDDAEALHRVSEIMFRFACPFNDFSLVIDHGCEKTPTFKLKNNIGGRALQTLLRRDYDVPHSALNWQLFGIDNNRLLCGEGSACLNRDFTYFVCNLLLDVPCAPDASPCAAGSGVGSAEEASLATAPDAAGPAPETPRVFVTSADAAAADPSLGSRRDSVVTAVTINTKEDFDCFLTTSSSSTFFPGDVISFPSLDLNLTRGPQFDFFKINFCEKIIFLQDFFRSLHLALDSENQRNTCVILNKTTGGLDLLVAGKRYNITSVIRDALPSMYLLNEDNFAKLCACLDLSGLKLEDCSLTPDKRGQLWLTHKTGTTVDGIEVIISHEISQSALKIIRR